MTLEDGKGKTPYDLATKRDTKNLIMSESLNVLW